MSLKKNLVRFMDEKGLTIKRLAEITEISEPTLKRLRTQENTNPTLEILAKLSSALQIPLANLIQDEEFSSVIYQKESLCLPKDFFSFTFIFTRDTFNFLKGSKAIFKRYLPNDHLTKYIITIKGEILEKVNSENFLFRNEKLNIFSLEPAMILAYIIKEIYEVSYV